MSALEALLGPRPGAGSPTSSPRTLEVDGDVLIYLDEDETSATVTLYSVPGSLPETARAWLDALDDPWVEALVHPDHPDARAELQVDPATRRVFLADVWPRGALDGATLGRQLGLHAHRHRAWHARLREAAEDGLDAGRDDGPAPGGLHGMFGPFA